MTVLPSVIGFLSGLTLCMGWGFDGHRIVAQVAQERLNTNAAKQVLNLIGTPMWDVSTWADNIKYDDESYAWSKEDHFINIPQVCNFDYSRDCGDDNCVAGSIFNYTLQLTGELSGYNQTEALMWLIHYHGDIHQPLHTAFLDDYGGNTIHVTFYGYYTNLHKVWDTSMIYRVEHDFMTPHSWESISTKLTADLANGTWGEDQKTWEDCKDDRTSDIACPIEWGEEGIELACQYAYKDVTPGANLGDKYFNSRMPVMMKRLAQAGVRLAATLNRIWPLEEGELELGAVAAQ